MISTAYLKPGDKPQEYFFLDPRAGDPVKVSKEAQPDSDRRYASVLSGYIELVERIRESDWNQRDEIQTRELIVEQVRAKVLLEQIDKEVRNASQAAGERESAGKVGGTDEVKHPPLTSDQRETMEQLLPVLGQYAAAMRETGNLQKQMLLDQGKSQREKNSTHTLLGFAVAAIVSRNALDKAILDLQKKRWAYRNIPEIYRDGTKRRENVLQQDKEDLSYRSVRILVDEIDLESRGASIPRPKRKR